MGGSPPLVVLAAPRRLARAAHAVLGTDGGFAVATVETGDALVRTVESGETAVAVADVALLGRDHWTPLARLVALTTPVIVLARPRQARRGYEALARGALDAVLTRDLGRLSHAVQRALDNALTHRRLRELREALQESDDRLTQLTAHTDLVFWITDPAENRVLFVSPAYERIWGQTCESLYRDARSWSAPIHPDDRERVVAAFATGGFTGEYEQTYRLLRPDGSVRLIVDRSFVLRNAAGSAYRAAGVSEDITQRYQLQAALDEKIAELERSNKELDEFASIASHDLQEPLRMVTSYIQLLRRRCGDAFSGEAEDFFGFVVDGAHRMKARIDGLLEFARVKTRAHPMEPVNLGAVLDDVRQDLEIAIGESQARFEVGVLPTVWGDPMQLHALLQNLLSNAIKFRAAGRALVVRVSAEPDDGGRYEITVADNGIGIPEDSQKRVFGIFQRVHPDHDAPGTGIGLAVCARVVQRHGSQIAVQSEPGAGSAFSFTLPRVPATGVHDRTGAHLPVHAPP